MTQNLEYRPQFQSIYSLNTIKLLACHARGKVVPFGKINHGNNPPDSSTPTAALSWEAKLPSSFQLSSAQLSISSPPPPLGLAPQTTGL